MVIQSFNISFFIICFKLECWIVKWVSSSSSLIRSKVQFLFRLIKNRRESKSRSNLSIHSSISPISISLSNRCWSEWNNSLIFCWLCTSISSQGHIIYFSFLKMYFFFFELNFTFLEKSTIFLFFSKTISCFNNCCKLINIM